MEFPVTQLRPHSLNGEIYGESEPADDLVQSIRERGILEPLVIKQDGTIISGHRRWRAAVALKMESVPCRIAEYTDVLDEQEAVIEFNRQRVKTSTQRQREANKVWEIEEARARMRQGTRTDIGAILPESDRGRTRDKVAEAVGMKPRTFDKERTVYLKAEAGDPQARELMARLDKGQTTINAAYNEVKRIEKQNGHESNDGLPKGRYATIIADPPWRYDNTATRAAAENHYPTLTVEELCVLPIAEKAADNAHLYLWTTNSMLEDAFKLVRAWGFEYKTLITWVKPQIGLGNYFRNATEHVLFCVRGSLAVKSRNLRNWFEAPREEHSRKPERFIEIVEQASPGPYLELFARRPRLGWEVWGNEV